MDKAELDAFVENAILAYLARDDVYEALVAAQDSNDAELAQVRDELAEARAEHDELSRKVADGALSMAFAAKTEPRLLARIDTLQQRETELATPSVLGGLITPGKDVARRWQDCELSTRRAVAKMVLSPELLGELRVLRSPTPGHRVQVEQRVMLSTRAAETKAA